MAPNLSGLFLLLQDYSFLVPSMAIFYCKVGGLMEQRVSNLEKDMTEVKTRLAVAEAGLKDMKEDMQSIKNNTTWILRLIVGAIVGALLGLVFKNGGI